MDILWRVMLVFLRATLCVVSGILFLIGLAKMFSNPNWEAAKYMAAGVFVIYQAFSYTINKSTPKT